MKLRVGLVGLGSTWEQRHSPALRALADRFEVRAVCEQVPRRAEQAAAQFGADTVDGFRALVAREDIDAILMLAVQWYGPLPILAACDTGKAVYCGAGLDLQLDEARLIRDRVETAGIAFMAEFPRRQSPATLRLKELIATRLGRPRLLFCHLRAPSSDHPNAAADGIHCGVTVNDLVELVDWCRYVVGQEATYVTGLMHAGRSEHPAEDYQMLSLDFSAEGGPGSGPVAQISCGRYIPADWQEAITYRPLAAMQVSCEHGIAFVDMPSTLVWFDEAGRHQESLESERPVGERLLSHFHRAVTSLLRKTCDLEDAYRALYIVQQARRSHALGRRMELEP